MHLLAALALGGIQGTHPVDIVPERPLNPPEQDAPPCCPWCGAECDTLYRIPTGEIVGCEHCVDTLDAWEYRHLAG